MATLAGISMDEDCLPIGSPITLAELKSLGGFVRWQDVGPRVAALAAASALPHAYPIVASRLPSRGLIDLCVDQRWRQVHFVGMEASLLSGDRRIVYLDNGAEKSIPYDWYGVAPAGHYTGWEGPRPESLAGAILLDQMELAQQGHVIQSQAVEAEDWPYLTFRVRSYHRNARWVELEDMWTGSYTVHVADPRVAVEGIRSHEPWFNTTIAVSHRWLDPHHPDPEGTQYRELMMLSETLGLHDSQAFLIDYCSLPQHPRTSDEEALFRELLPVFQRQFKYVAVVLNTGSADYSTRAWCMFELMLAAMSRTPQPTLLNHDRLEEPLRNATQLAKSYLQESVWNQQQMSSAWGSGLTSASFAKWSRDPINIAIYNAAIDGRRTILEKFQNELAVTDPNDKPIILDLLERLAFQRSDV